MSGLQPTHFENYPPEPTGVTGDGTEQPAAGGGLTPSPPYFVAAASGTSRRKVLGWMIGVPVVLGFGLYSMGSSDEDSEEEVEATSQLVLDGHWITIPPGWTAQVAGDVATLHKGSDQIMVQVIQGETSSASGVIAARAGKLLPYGLVDVDFEDAVDNSTDDYQRVSALGHAVSDHIGVRLLADLWLDEDGDGLIVVRYLVSAEGTEAFQQAEDTVTTLGEEFE